MRSHDGGKTWGEMRLLKYENTPYEINGGTPIYDELHDTLILLARSRHFKPCFIEERAVSENDQICGKTYERFWISKSTDGGLSWSDYKEITIDGIPEHWTVQSCTTPGIGIQLKKQKDQVKNGRLIVPANHASLNSGKNEFCAHILISDDFGETWRVGAYENYVGANESVAVELNDGTIVYSCRNQGGIPGNLRIQGFSYDGGETLENSKPLDTLYDPVCHAGISTVTVNSKEYIFFTEPSGELGEPFVLFGVPMRSGKRESLMLYASCDGGKTYKAIKQISEKGIFAAYSALCVTHERRLLCAWESGPELELYRDIKYTSFEIDELVKLCEME